MHFTIAFGISNFSVMYSYSASHLDLFNICHEVDKILFLAVTPPFSFKQHLTQNTNINIRLASYENLLELSVLGSCPYKSAAAGRRPSSVTEQVLQGIWVHVKV